MRICLANHYLQPAINLLDGMKLAGAASRARTRLIRLLAPHLEALQEGEYALVTEHATCGADGKPIIADDGSFTLKDNQHATTYITERDALFAEIAQIEGGTYEGHRQACIDLLTTYDGQLSGTDADAYDALLTALEEGNADGE
ncbi:MAG: hypothetical protein PUK59_04755 [Actinomycetaceae bacterium]|nr:hypothetical protein [Actinomycetaceae bacterium]